MFADLELEHLVRAMFCAPGRTRTYDRQIRRLLLYPLSYGGQERAVRGPARPGSRITVAPVPSDRGVIGGQAPQGTLFGFLRTRPRMRVSLVILGCTCGFVRRGRSRWEAPRYSHRPDRYPAFV
jgi:hypothetical protein